MQLLKRGSPISASAIIGQVRALSKCKNMLSFREMCYCFSFLSCKTDCHFFGWWMEKYMHACIDNAFMSRFFDWNYTFFFYTTSNSPLKFWILIFASNFLFDKIIMAINHLCENMNKRMISMAQLLSPLWLWHSIMHKQAFAT